MSKFVSLRGVTITIIWTLVFTAVVASANGSWTLSQLHSFGNPALSANQPSSGLILASDGKLYGTASGGGANNAGVVFRSNKDGSGFQIICDFAPPGADGLGARRPVAGVLEASDGKFYGTTFAGGTHSGGTVYCLERDGSGFQVIHDFERSSEDNGADPYGELIEGRDGLLYGTTRSGGSLDNGTIFRMAKDGSAYQVLHEFDFNSGAGAFPEAPLLRGSDGVLYGATSDHRSDIDSPGNGKIFKINPDGSGYAVIHDFDLKAGDGNYPGFGLTEGRDGALYGTTFSGGASNGGVVFKLRKNGAGYHVLWSLPYSSLPFGPLRVGSASLLYGITYAGGPGNGATIYSINENGTSPRVLDTFGRTSRDVQRPVGALAQDAAGNLYGGSMAGGIGGGGTIFRCPLNGTHRILHSFNPTGGDGGLPDSRLALGTNGILYGTTRDGGWFGSGTVYQVDPNRSGYKVLVNLSERPIGVVADPMNGDLYLTTLAQSIQRNHFLRYTGKLYRVTPGGQLKLLHGFHPSKGIDAEPNPPLVASDGMLYGIVSGGERLKDGFIYRIQKNGKGFQILYAFTNYAAFPPLIEGSDGMLYGVQPSYFQTPASVFKIGKDGTGFMNLHTFPAGVQYDLNTYSQRALVEGSAGLIYGTTDGSSPVAFRMDKTGGNFQVVRTFSSEVSGLTKGSDGGIYGVATAGSLFRIDTNSSVTTYQVPISFQTISGLAELPDGSFCGTTWNGGDMNIGDIFRLTPP